jgi:hypothetical protein
MKKELNLINPDIKDIKAIAFVHQCIYNLYIFAVRYGIQHVCMFYVT